MSENREYARYVRRQIGGDDIAFHLENRGWDSERSLHLLECMTIVLRLLTAAQFVRFHTDHSVEFNALAEDLEGLGKHDHNWYNQDDHIDHCMARLHDTVRLIAAMLDLTEEV